MIFRRLRDMGGWLTRADESSLLVLVVLIAALVRIAAIVAFSDVHPATANVWEYGEQARCALRNGGQLCLYYHEDPAQGSFPSAYMPPIFSYLWLGFMYLFGDTSLARVSYLMSNLVAGVADVALVFFLAKRLGLSLLASALSAVTLAIYPTFVFVAATYHVTNFNVFFILTLAYLTSVALEELPQISVRTAGLLGLVAGLSALNRSEMLGVAPAMFLIVAICRRSFRIVLIATFAMCLVLSPWVVRNYYVFHRFIPAAQSAGYNLWKGFNACTNGSGKYSETAPACAAMMNKILHSVPEGPDFEGRVQQAFGKEFTDYIHTVDVDRLVSLSVNKVALLWVFDWTESGVTGGLVYRLPWLIVSFLAISGVIILIRSRGVNIATALSIVSLLVLLTASYVVTCVHARYRMHIEPFLFIFAAVGAEGLIRLVWSTYPESFNPHSVPQDTL